MISDSNKQPVQLGVCGLGRAFMLSLATLIHDPRVSLVAAADTRANARARFSKEFDAPCYADLDELCHDPRVEAIYIATPHQYHEPHACQVIAAGKAALIEKPVAATNDAATAIVDALKHSDGICVIGPGHSYDEPCQQAARLVKSGEFGALRHISASNYTDFLLRPRPTQDLLPPAGGIVLNQGAHQVDIARLLANSDVIQVQAMTRAWHRQPAVVAAYSARIAFANAVTADLFYSGDGHYNSAFEFDGIGELGLPYTPARKVSDPLPASARGYGHLGINDIRQGRHHESFGRFVLQCDHATLVTQPDGVMVYRHGVGELRLARAPTGLRDNWVSEFYAAIRHHNPPLHDARWGAETLRTCIEILNSATMP